LLLAGGAGLLQTLSFAPFSLWWLTPLTLGVLYWLTIRAPRIRDAALIGFTFGVLHFCAGVSWLYISLHDFGQMAAWLAVLGVFLLACYMALFPMLATLLTRWLGVQQSQPTAWATLLFACTWFLAEFGRGWVFTGFPWLASGYGQIDGWLAGWPTLVGVYGTGLVLALLAATAASWALQGLRSDRRVMVILVVGVMIGLIAQRYPQASPASATLSVRLLQGNVPQSMKFERDTVIRAARDYLQMVDQKPADLIVLPETAVPVPPALYPSAIEALQASAKQSGSTILLGVPDHQDDRWTNSAIAILPNGSIAPQRYDKQHLVPFGEFIPWGFKWFVDAMQMPLGDFARGAVIQPPFVVKGIKIAPNICYEDVFGDELRLRVANTDVFLNLSNLAWFGDSAAMPQHLQIARMRSLELGRPSLRATNTGVTAAIDANGDVLQQLDLNKPGSLDVTLAITKRDTLYAQIGDVPLLIFAALVLAQCYARRERRRKVAVDVEDVDFKEL
jgi:apolipoprotein N-acyltransferase